MAVCIKRSWFEGIERCRDFSFRRLRPETERCPRYEGQYESYAGGTAADERRSRISGGCTTSIRLYTGLLAKSTSTTLSNHL
jgi:hypothetical protein